MAENFQDNVAYNGSTLFVSGDALKLGSTDNGAKSIVFNNSGSEGHLAWQPSANRTINLPDAGGTLLLSSQGILSLSAGGAQVTSGQVIFSNSNGVSFGVNGQTVTAAHNALTTAALSGDTSKYVQNWKLTGNTAGTTSSAQGTDLWFSGGANLSVSGNSNTIVFSVGNYITTARASNDGVGLNTAKTNVTWTVNSSGLSLDAGGYAGTGFTSTTTAGTAVKATQNTAGLSMAVPAFLTAAAGGGFSAGVSTGGNTAGNTGVTGTQIVFVGSNNITLSQNTDANGATITVSGATAAAAPVNFSAGTTSNNLGSVVFSNSNLVSFGLNGSTITGSVPGTSSLSATGAFSISVNGSTISMGVPTQTNQTLGLYAVGNTTGQSSSSTFDARTLSFVGQGIASVGYSNGSVNISVPSGGAADGYNIVAAGTVGTTGTTWSSLSASVFLNGSHAITISQNNSNQIVVDSPATSSLSATGWASISTNGSTISIGATATKNLYAIGNTFGTSSGTGDMRTVSLAGSGAASVAASNSGWVISVPTLNTLSVYDNFEWDAALSGTVTFGLSTGYFVPVNILNTVQWNQLGMVVSASLPTTSCGNTVSVSFGTSGQSLQVDHFHSFTGSNLIDHYLLVRGGGGSSTDLVTISSTRNTVVTFLNETWRVLATAGNASQTATVSNSVSLGVSFPAITSATSTSVNAGTTVTMWGPGYSSWGSTASGSTTSSKTTGATMSISIGSTYPATTVWSSNKIVQFNWAAGVVNPAQYWIGIVRGNSSSSSSSSASTSGVAGRSFTSSINMSDLTMTAQLSWAGITNSIASSLGTFGGNSQATAALGLGHGTYSATYAGSKTFMNNAGQANGEIALSDIGTTFSFFKPWLQFNSNRI